MSRNSIRQNRRAWLFGEWDGCCAYCGAEATTEDHIVPLSKGGNNTWKNVVPACFPCNNSKGARDVVEFLRKRPERLVRILAWQNALPMSPPFGAALRARAEVVHA